MKITMPASSRFLFIVLFSFGSFLTFINTNSVGQASGSIPFTRLEGFQPKPAAVPKTGYFNQLYYNLNDFNGEFTSQPVSGQKSFQPDFKKNYVIVCVGSKSASASGLKIEKLVKKQTVLHVYYLTTTDKKLSSSPPVCVFSTPIDLSLSGMVYYVNGKVVLDVRN
jgi:hypothetical protein